MPRTLIDPNGRRATSQATWSQVIRGHGDTTLISWKPEPVTVGGLPARQQALLDIEAVKPLRKRGGLRPVLEADGEARLKAEPKDVKRPWVARVYFLSEGGEQLCAEFGGLTEPESYAMESAPRLPGGVRPPCRERFPFKTPRGEPPPPPPHEGWRKVVFPSERTERPVFDVILGNRLATQVTV